MSGNTNEPFEKLSKKTLELHRALHSLIEELEAALRPRLPRVFFCSDVMIVHYRVLCQASKGWSREPRASTMSAISSNWGILPMKS